MKKLSPQAVSQNQTNCLHRSIKNCTIYNLCKQNFVKTIDERPLGLRRDFGPSHMIKKSVDAAYLSRITCYGCKWVKVCDNELSALKIKCFRSLSTDDHMSIHFG